MEVTFSKLSLTKPSKVFLRQVDIKYSQFQFKYPVRQSINHVFNFVDTIFSEENYQNELSLWTKICLKNIQTEEKSSRWTSSSKFDEVCTWQKFWHFIPKMIFQTCSCDTWIWQSEASSYSAWWWGHQRVGGLQHGGLREPDHDVGGHPGRLLQGGHLPRHVRRGQVRVSLGGREPRQDPHQVLRPQVHWLPHDLDPGPGGRWVSVSQQNWGSFS